MKVTQSSSILHWHSGCHVQHLPVLHVQRLLHLTSSKLTIVTWASRYSCRCSGCENGSTIHIRKWRSSASREILLTGLFAQEAQMDRTHCRCDCLTRRRSIKRMRLI